METTLSVRNLDPKENIAFVSFYDINAKTIKNYIEKPMLLKSLSTADFKVAQKEIEGAWGADFLVEWTSVNKVNKLVIEVVMTVNCSTLRNA